MRPAPSNMSGCDGGGFWPRVRRCWQFSAPGQMEYRTTGGSQFRARLSSAEAPRLDVCGSPRPTPGRLGQAIPAVTYAVTFQAGGRFLAIESATLLFTDVVGSAEVSQRP